MGTPQTHRNLIHDVYLSARLYNFILLFHVIGIIKKREYLIFQKVITSKNSGQDELFWIWLCLVGRCAFGGWRRSRDSNSGTVARRRFSRPLPSATRPLLRNAAHYKRHGECCKVWCCSSARKISICVAFPHLALNWDLLH